MQDMRVTKKCHFIKLKFQVPSPKFQEVKVKSTGSFFILGLWAWDFGLGTLLFYTIFSLFIFQLCIPQHSFAQDLIEQDAAIWTNFYMEKKLVKKIVLHNNMQVRYNNNMSRIDYWFNDFGITYSPVKKIKFAADYVYSIKNLPEYFSKRHQFYVDAIFIQPLYRTLRFSYRCRLQSTYRDIGTSEKWDIPASDWRNKLTLKFSYFRFSPYISFEPLYNFQNAKGNDGFKRNRYYAGCFYKLNRNNKVELYYMIQQYYNINRPRKDYVIGIGYELTL